MSVCFIIACKVYKNYKSYIPFYVKNIKSFYKDYKIILVDNNSKYGKDFFKQFDDDSNIIVLENLSESKFEVGAYNYAIEYIKKNNLIYEYYVFTQDTMVLIKPYDFTVLKQNSITACPIGTFIENNNYGCWCNSFILNLENMLIFNISTKDIIIRNRSDSVHSERWLGNLLLQLNNNILYSIVGDHMDSVDKYRNNYAQLLMDIESEEIKKFNFYFVKDCQQKTENTIE